MLFLLKINEYKYINKYNNTRIHTDAHIIVYRGVVVVVCSEAKEK